MKKLLLTIITVLLFGLSGYSQNTLDSGRIAWYPFNGNTLDMSGNGHNGINHGATLTMDRDSNLNSAYLFNSINNYIEINNDTLLQLNNTDYTISTWVYRTYSSHSQHQAIISKRDANTGWLLYIDVLQSYRVGLYISIGQSTSYSLTSTPKNGWIHIVEVYTLNDSTVKTYVNGIQEKTTSGVLPPDQTICHLYIGSDLNTQYYFHGKIDDIGIWNRALTQNEIYLLNYIFPETDIICDNDSLLWHGLLLTAQGVYYDSLLSINNHDSVYKLTLIVNPTYFFAETDTVCDNLLWHGLMLTTTGIYYDSLLSMKGCDSIYKLILTVNNSPISQIICSSSTTFCQDDSITLFSNINHQSYKYQWRHNGVNINGATNPYLSIKTAGDYTILITDSITTCQNISNTISTIVNSNNFNVAFSENQNVFIQPPFNVLFVNNTPSASNYNFVWSFGDGTTFYGVNPPIHTYPANGNYDVALLAIHKVTGCIDTLIKPDWVVCIGGQNCTHTAVLKQSGTLYGCAGDSVKLSVVDSTGFTFQWNWNGMPIMGADDSIYYPKYNGTYSVTVFLNACPVISAPVQVYFNPGPPKPIITSSGIIAPCSSDSIQLTAHSNNTTLLWSTGAIISTIWVSQSGSYFVTATATNGCSTVSDPFNVNASLLATPEICIVSVDFLTSKNIVIFEKPITTTIDTIIIYKETTQANIYTVIGKLSYVNFSTFIDTASHPAQNASRYKISYIDTCGVESNLSDYHKTIHLTINSGFGNTWNLIWDGYQGFNFLSYNIYRGTSLINLTYLTQIQSNLSSWTDLTPPSGNVYYQIEVVNTGGCNPSKSYSSSRSNITNSLTAGVNTIQIVNDIVNIYPNPVDNHLTILFMKNLDIDVNLFIFNVNKQLVYSNKYIKNTNKINIDINWPSGFYYLNIVNKDINIRKGFIVK